MRRSHIMIHHSFTEDGVTVSWPAIRRYHVVTNGWKDIGYHYGVELVTDTGFPTGDPRRLSIEALIGRPQEEIAAACPQGRMNEIAYHVCCVGNFDDAPPSEALLDVLVKRILVPLVLQDRIALANVVGHRDFNPHKTCPGTKFDLNRVRVKLHDALGGA